MRDSPEPGHGNWPRQFLSAFGRGRYLLAALVVMGCQPQPRPAEPPKPPSTPDSLALRMKDGLSVWFTDPRLDQDSAGNSCTERVLQIRRDSVRTPIPLLYTGKAPLLLNDSTIEAELWLHCRAMDRYRVNLRTGRPIRVPQ